MKIVNTTQWSTRDLRRFITPIARAELSAEQRRRLTLTLTPASWFHGHAYVNGRSATVYLPRVTGWTAGPRLAFCHVLAHEFHHVSGRAGGRANEYAMRRSVRYGRPRTEEGKERQQEFYGWALALPTVQPKAVRIEPPVDRQAIKRQRAEAALARWRTKLKRAQTAIRKYELQLKRWDREQLKLAATS